MFRWNCKTWYKSDIKSPHVGNVIVNILDLGIYLALGCVDNEHKFCSSMFIRHNQERSGTQFLLEDNKSFCCSLTGG